MNSGITDLEAMALWLTLIHINRANIYTRLEDSSTHQPFALKPVPTTNAYSNLPGRSLHFIVFVEWKINKNNMKSNKKSISFFSFQLFLIKKILFLSFMILFAYFENAICEVYFKALLTARLWVYIQCNLGNHCNVYSNVHTNCINKNVLAVIISSHFSIPLHSKTHVNQ